MDTRRGDKSSILHVGYVTLTLQLSWTDRCLSVKCVYSTVWLITRCLSLGFMGPAGHATYLDAWLSFFVPDCPSTLPGTHIYDDGILVDATEAPCGLYRLGRTLRP